MCGLNSKYLGFLDIFLLLISSLITVVTEQTLHDINSLKFVEGCFMSQII